LDVGSATVTDGFGGENGRNAIELVAAGVTIASEADVAVIGAINEPNGEEVGV
jgi:hypothetical protein